MIFSFVRLENFKVFRREKNTENLIAFEFSQNYLDIITKFTKGID
jgi:hypothetical protein